MPVKSKVTYYSGVPYPTLTLNLLLEVGLENYIIRAYTSDTKTLSISRPCFEIFFDDGLNINHIKH